MTLPSPDTPTPKAQEGTWTLTAPGGRTWQAGSPLKACGMEQRERVPPGVALARIYRELDAPAEAGSAPLPQIQARYRGLDGKWTDWLPVLDGTTVEYRIATPLSPKQSEPPKQEREAFEAHYKPNALDFDLDKDAWGRPKYKHPHIESLWNGWVARGEWERAKSGGSEK